MKKLTPTKEALKQIFFPETEECEMYESYNRPIIQFRYRLLRFFIELIHLERKSVDRLFCQAGLHQYKPWDFQEWDWCSRSFKDEMLMRWKCQACIDRHKFFIDIHQPTDNQIKVWNDMSQWSKSSKAYITKIPE